MSKKVCKVKQGLLLLGCLVAAVGCKQAPPTQMETGYEVMTVSPTDRMISSAYSATIRGRQDIDIYPQVGGTLTKVSVTEGQRVKSGQTLFIIDQVPYEAALQTAVANVESAKASLATAQLTYDSKEELYKENVVSAFDLSTAKNSLLAAKAQLAQAKAQEVSARNNLSYTVVKSPADGVIGTLPYRVGALVSSNLAEPLTTVSDNSDMYVYFSMTERQILELVAQYGAENFLQKLPTVSLKLSDGSIYPLKGRIETVSGIIDTQTGSSNMRATFENPNRLLRSGGSGVIMIPMKNDHAILVPQKATYEIQDKKFVYVLNDDSTVTSTEITIASIDNGKEYMVTSGLKAGDRIVTEGVNTLKDGMTIKAAGSQNNQ